MSLLDEFGGVAERYRRVYRDAFGRGVPEGVVPSDGELDAAAVRWPLLLEPQVRAFFQTFAFDAPLGWLDLAPLGDLDLWMEAYQQSLEQEVAELEYAGMSWGEANGLEPGPVVLPIAGADAQSHLVERHEGGIRVISYGHGCSDPLASVCARDVLSFVSAIVAVVETGRLEANDYVPFHPYGAFNPDDEMLLPFTDILDAHGANEDLFFTGWAHMRGRAKFPYGNQPRPS